MKISKRELLSEKYTNESTFYGLISYYNDIDVSAGAMYHWAENFQYLPLKGRYNCVLGGISVMGGEKKFFPEPVEDDSRISLSSFALNFLNASIPFS